MTEDLLKGPLSPTSEKRPMLVDTSVFAAGVCASMLIVAVGILNGHISIKFTIGLVFVACQSYINIALPGVMSIQRKGSPKDTWGSDWSLIDAVALRVFLLFSIYLAVVRPSLHTLSVYAFILPILDATQLLCFFTLVSYPPNTYHWGLTTPRFCRIAQFLRLPFRQLLLACCRLLARVQPRDHLALQY